MTISEGVTTKLDLLSVQQAATVLGVSEAKIYELAHAKMLASIRISPRHLVIPRKGIDHFQMLRMESPEPMLHELEARRESLLQQIAELETKLETLKRRVRPAIGYTQRQRIIARDMSRCRYCGKKTRGLHLNLDHVIPYTHGGGRSDDNLVVACRRCNMRKRDMSPEQAGMALLPCPTVA